MIWIRNLIDQIAGLPPRSLWLWAERASLLTRIVAYTFVALRLISPLQWWKFIYRKISSLSLTGDHHQKRTNFHAFHTEMYFLFVLLLTYLVYKYWATTTLDRIYFSVAIAFITIETFTWVAYYLFWRNYAEPKFSLYSPAEYLVLFPVVIAIQVLGFAFLYEAPPQEIFLSFFDNSGSNPWYFRLLGFFYFVIVIANLRAMSPTTTFKRDNTINIIGCGDVVMNRILPALLMGNLNIKPLHIKIFSSDPSDRKKLRSNKAFKNINFVCPKGKIQEKQDAIVKECITQNSPVIIATPSDSHYFYLTKLTSANLPVICEKPLVRFKNEIQNILSNKNIYKTNLFALSYYSLEKALPLTYFLQLNPAHTPLLNVEGLSSEKANSDIAELSNILDDLGSIEKIDLYLNEGVGRSPKSETRLWTERPNEHAFETLIHLVILTNKILKSFSLNLSEANLECVRGSCIEASTSDATTYLRLSNMNLNQTKKTASSFPSINLTCGKYMPEKLLRRGGRLDFRNGFVSIDFDEMSISINVSGRKEVKIVTKSKQKYGALAALINRFIHSGYEGVRFDEFEEQVDVLSWMTGYEFEPPNCFRYSIKYNEDIRKFETQNSN